MYIHCIRHTYSVNCKITHTNFTDTLNQNSIHLLSPSMGFLYILFLPGDCFISTYRCLNHFNIFCLEFEKRSFVRKDCKTPTTLEVLH